MDSILTYLTADHDRCDALLAEAEDAVARAHWAEARARLHVFTTETLRHLAREEDVLFPAFEAQTGMHGGPTYVMRQEHAQVREIVAELAVAAENRDEAGFLGQSETLLMLMRQHNLKEEQILYPMCAQALADRSAELLQAMDEI